MKARRTVGKRRAAATYIAGGAHEELVKRLVRTVGSHKVMYGTDWPYWASGKDRYRKGEYRWTMIEEFPELSDQDKRSILAENAERFVRFGLPKAPVKQS